MLSITAQDGTKGGDLKPRPVIAVTTSEVRTRETLRPTEHTAPVSYEMVLGMRYLRAIEEAGGLPLVAPPLAGEALEPLLERIDALCLSGGPDLHPDAYGAPPHPETGPCEPELDRFELRLAALAVARDLPVFAICRGMQLLNVALGGTLVQHLPDVTPLPHRQEEPCATVTQEVSVEAGSLLAEITGAARVAVNTFHHQGIERLGEGLRPAGRAADGSLEAADHPGCRFVLAVQWHAECLTERPEHAALFQALVTAAG